jgi:serine/threonine protein kinase
VFVADLLRQVVMSLEGTSMDCPDPDTLNALTMEQSLSPAERFRIAAHIAMCDACTAALEALEALRDATGELPVTRGVDNDGAHPGRHTIGRYVIEAIRGAGGMGVVYRAFDPELNRVVALKVLRRGADSARLKREAQALAKLDHPNVVAVYDVGTQDEMFIAMEYVDGDNLREWLGQATRDPRRVLDVLVDAGRGVAAMHLLGLIHRDLKPDNIFVSNAGQVLVGDFGLVRTPGSHDGIPTGDGAATAALTHSTIVGTPAYMPPEQAAREATAASDQFSFCVTAWEALTGERPFAGTSLKEIHANVHGAVIVEPAAKRALPRRVEAALRRGLAADPARRFASMEDLLRIIDRRKRTRWRLAAASTVGVAAIVIAVSATRSPTDPKQALLPCGDEDTLIAESWNPTLHAALERALARNPEQMAGAAVASSGAAPPPPPLVGHLLQLFDDMATTWTMERRTACSAQRIVGPARFASQRLCFDDLRRTLGDGARSLREIGELSREAVFYFEDALPVARCASATLPDIAPPTWIQAPLVGAVREALIRTAMLLQPSREGWARLKALAATAEQLGYEPLTGEILARRAEYAYALEIFDETITSARAANAIAGREHDDEAQVKNASLLAITLTRLGNLDGADEQLKVAGEAWQRTGRDARIEIPILDARADISRVRHAPDQLSLQEALVTRTREIYGNRSAHLAMELTILANLYPAKDAAKSRRAATEALAIWPSSSGHADFEMELERAIARLQAAKGDLPRMIATIQDVITLCDAKAPPDSEECVYAFKILGRYYEIATKWPDAIFAYRRAVERYDKLNNPDAQSQFDFLNSLGRAQLENRNLEESLATLLKARALMTDRLPKADDRLVLLEALGRTYEGLSRSADAISVLQPLIGKLRDTKPRMWMRLGRASASLARALWANGGARERDQARVLVHDAVEAFTAQIAEFKADPIQTYQIGMLERSRSEIQAWLAAR